MTTVTVLPAQNADHRTWAMGCEECQFGIIYAPPLEDEDKQLPLPMARKKQAQQGLIVFCECTAGQVYQQRMGIETKSWIERAIDAVEEGVNRDTKQLEAA